MKSVISDILFRSFIIRIAFIRAAEMEISQSVIVLSIVRDPECRFDSKEIRGINENWF